MPGPIDPLDVASSVRDVGRYIREQRRQAELSLRKLANQAGVSNPYLSQIERGLRRPSAVILKDIAHALRISAETLYVRAGILDESADAETLESAIAAEPHLSERQKQVLLDIYHSFLVEAKPADAPAARGADATARHQEPVAAAPTRRPRQSRAQRVEVTTPDDAPAGGTRARTRRDGVAPTSRAGGAKPSTTGRRRASTGAEGRAGGTAARPRSAAGTAEGPARRGGRRPATSGTGRPGAVPGSADEGTGGLPGNPAATPAGDAGASPEA